MSKRDLSIFEVVHGIVNGDPEAKDLGCQMLRDADLHEFIPLIREGTWPKRAAPMRPAGDRDYVLEYLLAVMHGEVERRKRNGVKFAKNERKEYLNKFLAILPKDAAFGYPLSSELNFFSDAERESLCADVLKVLDTRSKSHKRRLQKAEETLRTALLRSWR